MSSDRLYAYTLSSSRSITCPNCEGPNSRKMTYCGHCAQKLPEHDFVKKKEKDDDEDEGEVPEKPQKVESEAHLLSSALAKLIDVQSAPRVETQKFDGEDATQWSRFWNGFLINTDRKSLEPEQKLQQLIQSLEGRAKRAILPFTGRTNVKKAYEDAKERLESRFGDGATVAFACLAKLTSGKPIGNNDAEKLEEFCIDLETVEMAYQNLGIESQLDDRSRIMELWDRLPSYMQNDWTKKEALLKKGETMKFTDFKAFCEVYNKQKNLPGYSTRRKAKSQGRAQDRQAVESQCRSVSAPTDPGSNGAGRGTLSSSDQRSRRLTCAACRKVGKEETHLLPTCSRFQQLSPRERMSLVFENKLCFLCLSYSNHSSRECRGEVKSCGVDGCRMNHHPLIHQEHIQWVERWKENKKKREESGSIPQASQTQQPRRSQQARSNAAQRNQDQLDEGFDDTSITTPDGIEETQE